MFICCNILCCEKNVATTLVFCRNMFHFVFCAVALKSCTILSLLVFISWTTCFQQICLPLLQYFFNVENIPSSIPGHHKEPMTELVLPVTPVSRASLATPSSCKSGDTPRRKKMTFNSSKFDKNFVKKIMTLGCEMFHELLVANTERMQNGNYLTGTYVMISYYKGTFVFKAFRILFPMLASLFVFGTWKLVHTLKGTRICFCHMKYLQGL